MTPNERFQCLVSVHDLIMKVYYNALVEEPDGALAQNMAQAVGPIITAINRSREKDVCLQESQG